MLELLRNDYTQYESKNIISIFLITIFNLTKAQKFIQTIHGRIIDKDSKVPIPGTTRVTEQIQPPIGIVVDTLGYFILKKVPIGRYDIKLSCLGYEPYIISELFVTSGKEPVLDVPLTE